MSDKIPACYGQYDATHECQRCRALGPCYLAEQRKRREAEKSESKEDRA